MSHNITSINELQNEPILPKYSFMSDPCMQIANTLFLISYLQKELLLLRLILISAVLFLLFFAMKLPVLYLDAIVFDCLFIVINAFLSFKLISRLIPPKFTDEQKNIYNDYFCKILKPLEFKRLLKFHRRRVYRVNSNVINKGNCFESIFFIARVSRDSIKINVKLNGNSVAELTKYSWIGIVEYVELLTNKTSIKDALIKQDTGTWGINLEITIKVDDMLESISDDILDQKGEQGSQVHKLNEAKNSSNSFMENDEVILYEWDLETLDKIFSEKEEGKNIMHGLHSMWLVYFSKLITKSDKEIKKSIKNTAKRSEVILNDSDLFNLCNAMNNNPYGMKQNMTIIDK